MIKQIFSAIVYQEDDIYVAECPEVGTVSQGYTIKEAIDNLKEATELYLEKLIVRILVTSVMSKDDITYVNHSIVLYLDKYLIFIYTYVIL